MRCARGGSARATVRLTSLSAQLPCSSAKSHSARCASPMVLPTSQHFEDLGFWRLVAEKSTGSVHGHLGFEVTQAIHLEDPRLNAFWLHVLISVACWTLVASTDWQNLISSCSCNHSSSPTQPGQNLKSEDEENTVRDALRRKWRRFGERRYVILQVKMAIDHTMMLGRRSPICQLIRKCPPSEDQMGQHPAGRKTSFSHPSLGKMDWIAARGPQKPWRRYARFFHSDCV